MPCFQDKIDPVDSFHIPSGTFIPNPYLSIDKVSSSPAGQASLLSLSGEPVSSPVQSRYCVACDQSLSKGTLPRVKTFKRPLGEFEES